MKHYQAPLKSIKFLRLHNLDEKDKLLSEKTLIFENSDLSMVLVSKTKPEIGHQLKQNR